MGGVLSVEHDAHIGLRVGINDVASGRSYADGYSYRLALATEAGLLVTDKTRDVAVAAGASSATIRARLGPLSIGHTIEAPDGNDAFEETIVLANEGAEHIPRWTRLTFAPPYAANDRLYVRAYDHLWCIGRADE